MRLTRALTALAVAATLLLPPLPRAHADDTITDQKYAALVGIKALHDLGLTGKGITIAYIEGAPDLTVPELQGADIEIKNPCNHTSTPNSKSHSTAVVSILANKDWGWTPDAHIINYTTLTALDEPKDERCPAVRNLPALFHQALDDGADIISASLEFPIPTQYESVVLRANSMGVPIVVAVPNIRERSSPPNSFTDGSSLSQLNTVIGVGSLNSKLQRSEFSSVGEFVTIMAPGEDITVRRPDDNGNLTVIMNRYGTSYAAPMVTGLLALGKQKWPNATGNQLIRALINTAYPVGDQPNPYYGYGIIQSTSFLNTDPTTLEDTNPIFHRKDTTITPDKINDYQDGFIHPAELLGDPTYRYRGLDPKAVYYHPELSHFGTSPRYHR